MSVASESKLGLVDYTQSLLQEGRLFTSQDPEWRRRWEATWQGQEPLSEDADDPFGGYFTNYGTSD
jgi:hypothetical protein